MHPGGSLRPVVLACLLLPLAVAQGASAITIRDDKPDSDYLALATSYMTVGAVLNASGNLIGSGTLIAPNYVLTAAHVARNNYGFTFNLNGTAYGGTWSQTHLNWHSNSDTDWDIAVIRLNGPVTGVAPSPLYTATNELTQTGTFVGYGMTGTGLTGYVAGTQGTKRAGQNVLDAYRGMSPPSHQQVLVADFDKPNDPTKSHYGSSQPLPLECLVGTFDSGGPVFLSVAGVAHVAGIITAIYAWDGTADGSYGDAVYATRVSSFASWITGILAAGVHWSAGTGDYTTGSNWQLTAPTGETHANFVPNAYDNLFFDRAAAYTVNWPTAPVTNASLTVIDGSVTFNLNSTTYGIPTGVQPAMVVGNTAGKSPSLTIANGTLATDLVTLGAIAGSAGTLGVGSGGLLDVNRYQVFGTGSIDVAAGQTVTVPAAGEFTLGAGAVFNKNGPGTLVIEAPISLPADARINVNAGELHVHPLGGGTDAGLATAAGTSALNTGAYDAGAAGGLAVMPEPASLALLGCGLVALCLRKRSGNS